jgi:hypothetical protein
MSRLVTILAAGAIATLAGETPPQGPAPRPVEVRGQLVCLAEELRDAHRAAVPPVHDHVLALKAEAAPGPAAEGPRYYALLRTSQSQALFADERFKGRTLILTGRVFPGTSHLEVSRFQWLKDGKVHDVHYWCEVCSIRGVDPGPCACCQGAVELREAPAASGGSLAAPAERR